MKPKPIAMGLTWDYWGNPRIVLRLPDNTIWYVPVPKLETIDQVKARAWEGDY